MYRVSGNARISSREKLRSIASGKPPRARQGQPGWSKPGTIQDIVNKGRR